MRITTASTALVVIALVVGAYAAAPPPPASFVATAQPDGSVKLTWVTPPGTFPSPITYALAWSQDNTNWPALATLTAPIQEYVIPAATLAPAAGKPATFRIVAKVGGEAAPQALTVLQLAPSTAAAPSTAPPPPATPAAPVAPKNFKITNIHSTLVTLTWAHGAGGAQRLGYRIFVNEGKLGEATTVKLAKLNPQLTSTTISNLKVNTDYTFTIAALGQNDALSPKLTQQAKTIEAMPAPVVNGLQPANGPIAGGTQITVLGTGFGTKGGDTFTCKIGAKTAQAFRVSPTALRVTVPKAYNPGDVVVSCNINRGPYSTNQIKYKYIGAAATAVPPSVTSVNPPRGSVTGGTQVMVYGANFGTAAGQTVFCLFGDKPVPGQRLSPTTLRCTSPPHTAPGDIQIKVRINQGPPSTTAAKYTYVDTASAAAQAYNIKTIFPPKGPVSGGTQLQVTGTGFGVAANDRFICQFGAKTTPATRVSPSLLRCSAPPGAKGSVEFRVKKNNLDFASTTLQYTYEEAGAGSAGTPAAKPIVLTNITPSSGSAKGGQQCIIRGSGFGTATGMDFQCQFGDTIVSAIRLSPAVIRVSAPAHAAGQVAIKCRVSGGAWQGDGKLKFTYVAVAAPVNPSEVKIDYITPKRGPVSGGTQVLVHGKGFPATKLGGSLRLLPTLMTRMCKFGEKTVVARRISATLISCNTPAQEKEGPVPFSITFDGNNWIPGGDKNKFIYTKEDFKKTVIQRIYPARGSAGTQVRVIGSGFGLNPNTVFMCVFGTNHAPAIRVSPRELRCNAPLLALDKSQDLDFGVDVNGQIKLTSKLKFHYYDKKEAKEHPDWLAGGIDHMTKVRPVSYATIIGLSVVTYVVMTIIFIGALVVYQYFCNPKSGRRRSRRARLEEEDLGEELHLVDDRSAAARRASARSRDALKHDLEMGEED